MLSTYVSNTVSSTPKHIAIEGYTHNATGNGTGTGKGVATIEK